ncbi:hypothetical protein [Nodularia sp. LEGE 04288]|nr:hypothetical protein [Nodularia sp. LEGE 04288]
MKHNIAEVNWKRFCNFASAVERRSQLLPTDFVQNQWATPP